MRNKEKTAMPIQKREDVHRVAEYLYEKYKQGEMLRIMFLIGCNTGLRAGELRGLRIGDLLNGDSFTVVESKTKNTRQVFINSALKQAVEKYIKEPSIKIKIDGRKKTEIIKINLQDESDFILTGGQGAVIGIQYMHRVISGACRNLGIRGSYGSLSMAKTFAYHVFQRTGNINIVKSILAHSDRELTKNYIHDGRSLRMAKKDFGNGVFKIENSADPEVSVIKYCYEINLA